jgi:CRP-like cAMP-binding protein/predicted MFS family arabinose efflux permease
VLATAFIVNSLGSWAYTTVLIVYVYERTGSPTWISLVAASRWVPAMLLASYGGVLADRYERTRLLIYSSLLSCITMLAMAAVVASDGPLAFLLLLSAVSAAVEVPYRPASGALTPEVVSERELAAANGLFTSLESLSVVIGPALGGVLLLTDEPWSAVLLNAASFVIAAILMSRLEVRSRGGAGQRGESAFKAFTDGVTTLRSNSVATALVLYCALDSAVYGASTVLYVPISQQLGTGADGYGYLLAGAALGGVLAAGLANRLSASARLAPIILGGIACQAVPYAMTVFVHAPALGFLLQVIAGVGMILVDVLAITALQRDMPREFLGRVLSLLDVALIAATLIASFGFAFIFNAIDLHPSLYVLGVGFPLVAVLGIRPLLRADREAVATLRALEPRVALLQVLDLFSAAPRRTLEQLARSIEEVEVPAGTTLITEGDAPDWLWILVSGEVDVVVRDEPEGERRVRTLGPRSYFGEIGLLHGIPRTATVRALEPSVLWRISGDDFLDALNSSAPSASLLTLSTGRLSEVQPRAELPSPAAPSGR